MEKALINQRYLLQKFPGKGGWTYAAIPEIVQDKNAPFGWVRVKGLIDNIPIQQYHLMPMGNGQLFLPVKAEIRKKLGKQAGNFVQVILFKDGSALEIPADLLACLRDEPKAYSTFLKLSDSNKKQWIDWVYSARKDSTKVERITKLIDQMQKGNLGFFKNK
jgi:hypothetical protein